MTRWIVLLYLVIGAGFGTAQTPEVDPFDQLMDRLSNTHRWGVNDSLGTLNYITPARRLAAVQNILEGTTLSLAFPLDTLKTSYNRNPLEHRFFKDDEWQGSLFNADYYGLAYHGSMHTHVDGLTHITHKGKIYNNYSTQTISTNGAERLGIENLQNGIVGRAVLIDLPLLKGVEYLPPGSPIYTEDLLAFEQKYGVVLQQGDILLLYTGRWIAWEKNPHWEPFARSAGLHYSAMTYLYNQQIAVLGSDGINDVFPSQHPTQSAPVHKLALVAMGMPLLDNLNLDALADEARKREQWTFFFMASPLIVNGGTGSPLNPLILF
jgi:kynurenine formamidase